MKKIKQTLKIIEEEMIEKGIILLSKLSIKEILHLFSHASLEGKKKIIKILDKKRKIKFFDRIPNQELKEFLSKIEISFIKELIEELPIDISIKIIRNLDQKRREEVIEKSNLPLNIKRLLLNIKDLPEDAIGNYIEKDFIKAYPEDKIKDVLNKIKEREYAYINEIYVTDKDDNYLGIVYIRDLLKASPNEKIEKYIITDYPAVDKRENREKVILLFLSKDLGSIPVLDNKKLIGIVSYSTAIEILEEERIEDTFKLLYLSREEKITDPISKSIKNRTPWLILNLFTAFLNSLVINPFRDVIKSFVLFAIFLPIVAGEAGNATTQTMAITIRSLAIKNIGTGLKDIVIALKKEIKIAILNSIIVGIIASFFSYIWKGSLVIAISLMIAMFIDLMIAAMLGVLVPILLEKKGMDPASSSAIILTTFTDVFGFLTFLAIGSLLLKIFGAV